MVLGVKLNGWYCDDLSIGQSTKSWAAICHEMVACIKDGRSRRPNL
jgi:hypothetical protein